MSQRSPELADVIAQAIEDRLADVHVMLPGRIDSYDPATQKAGVEPLIKRLQSTVDGELSEDLPVIPGVPVCFPRAGGFKLTMPVQTGDRCMLVFCERSTETYQIGQERQASTDLIRQTDPGTFEMHNLSDPVAVLGWYNDAEALSATDETDMVMGEDGGPVVHIGNDQVNLYEKNAADFVALAAKVKTELDDFRTDLVTFQALFDSHIHLTTATVGATPVPGLISTTTPSSSPPHTPQSVAADKVKAT